jgi:hypothetical protein
MTTTPATAPFRFSLSHLFAATTLVAVALAGTFGPRWDADERWIIGGWFLGTLGLAATSRARGQRGLMSAILGGGLVPGSVAFAVPALGGGWSGPEERVVIVAAIVAITGALLGGLVVLLLEQVFVVRRAGLVQSLRLFFVNWRPPPTWTGAAVGLALAWAWLASSTTWRERVTIGPAQKNIPAVHSRYSVSGNPRDPSPEIALTSGGTLLAVCGYDAARSPATRVETFVVRGRAEAYRLDLWETGWPWPRHVGTRPLSARPFAADFSPDGQTLAVTHRQGITLWNTQAGLQWHTLPAPLLSIEPIRTTMLVGARFTDDGTALVARGWNVSQQSIFAWDASSWELVRNQSLAGHGSLQLNHGCNQFIRVIYAPGTYDASLELIDAQSLEVKRHIDHLGPPARPQLSPDDKLLAYDRRVWNLDSDREVPLPAPSQDFASGGRRIVALQRQVVTPGGGRLPVWLVSLPVLRHWFPAGQQTRLMLLDAHTGHPIVISRPLGEIELVTVSRNGRVVATATREGQIRIWDVPE